MDENENDEQMEYAAQQLRDFKAFVHAVIDGAEFVSMTGATFKGHPVTVIGIADDHTIAPFALLLNDDMEIDGLEVGLCEDCAAHEADEILRSVDFDAPIPFSIDDENKE